MFFQKIHRLRLPQNGHDKLAVDGQHENEQIVKNEKIIQIHLSSSGCVTLVPKIPPPPLISKVIKPQFLS